VYALAASKDTKAMNDKDLEAKLRVLKDILDFKFKIPPNIFQSIFQTLVLLLLDKVDLDKDFLVSRVLDSLESLCATQNSEAAINQAGKGAKGDGPLFDFIKWCLSLIKEKNALSEQGEDQEGQGQPKFNMTTPEIQLHSMRVLRKMVEILTMENSLLILPGLSSVASKAIAGEIKCRTKIKQEFVEIWLETVLPKYIASLKEK
jgi:hypothetical protein